MFSPQALDTIMFFAAQTAFCLLLLALIVDCVNARNQLESLEKQLEEIKNGGEKC